MKSSHYQNASEVLREGLRLVERQEAEDQARLEVLRKAVEEGKVDLAAGRFVDVADEDLDAYLGQIEHRASRSRRAG